MNNQKIVCAYNGKKGAYAEQAVINYFGNEDCAFSVESFDDIFNAVVDGRADFGMVPIENCTAGFVFQNYDNITRHKDVSIIGATTIRIEHSIMACENASWDSIEIVTSHPQALGQCSEFIKAHNLLQENANSTSDGAANVAKLNSPRYAAIANARNAELYGLKILEKGIENNPNNYTRFLVIASTELLKSGKLDSKFEKKSPNMLSLVFDTKNEQGALYHVLGVFDKYNINLNRLESRPIIGKPWRYWFYTDGKIREDEKNPEELVQNLLKDLGLYAGDIRLLGVYNE